MSTALADAVLRPRGVAVIGASADPAKNAGRPLRYLRRHGYPGHVVAVNPTRTEVQGMPCIARLQDASATVDHAYIMVPTAAVEAAIDDCIAAGVRCASIFSGGFAEAGAEGASLQRRVADKARAGGLRLLGPNSLGVITPAVPMALSANAVLERERLPRGSVGLVSQSGSLIGALLSRGEARGMGFSALVSVGNEADLGVGEMARMLVDDPNTDVVVLFLETLRDPDALEEAARTAHARGKPILAYLLGRSAVGQALARSHTGALAGAGRALAAFLDDVGIARIESFESLIEAPALFRGRRAQPGRRVAVVATTGGGGALVADHLGLRGLELATPPADLQRALAAHGLEIGAAPVVDLTMAGARGPVVDACLDALLGAPDVDGVVMVVGSSAEFKPELAVGPLAQRAGAQKPLAAFLFPNATASLSLLADAGIAAFRTPEACADAMAACLNWQPPRALPQAKAPAPPTGRTDELTALGLFAELGIEVAAARRLERDEPLPDDLDYPVVVKALSADLAHKSDVGAVVVGVADASALAAACAAIVERVAGHRPDIEIDAFLVQPQVAALGEALIGFRRDPLAGPIVVAGAGGLLAETLDDVSIRRAPVDTATAASMLREVRGLALLRGARGRPEGDLDALAAALAKLSQLAAAPAVLEAEINPVLVRSRGAVAVDGLLVLEEGAS